MKSRTTQFDTQMKSNPRTVIAKVQIKRGNTTYTIKDDDFLVSLKIDCQPPAGKFFGFLMCQKLELKINNPYKDSDMEYTFPTFMSGDRIQVDLGANVGSSQEYMHFPYFYVDTCALDEQSATLSITAYDILAQMTAPIKDIIISAAYPDNVHTIAYAICEHYGQEVYFTDNCPNLTTNLPRSKWNWSGNETYREILEMVAEVTGSIGYATNEGIVFKTPMDCYSEAYQQGMYTIDTNTYFDFHADEDTELGGIASVTDLNDNVIYEPTPGSFDAGYHQCLYNNALLTKQDDDDIWEWLYNISYVLDYARPRYSLQWRGNPAFEPFDAYQLSDEHTTSTYYSIGYQIDYDGGLQMTFEWEPSEADPLETQPKTVGETVRQTFAMVDKVNSQITLKADQVYVDSNFVQFGQLQDDTTVISGGNLKTGTIQAVDIDIGSGSFTVDNDGNMVCKDATITGNANFNGQSVNANTINTQSFTGASVTSDNITATNNIDTPQITLGNGIISDGGYSVTSETVCNITSRIEKRASKGYNIYLSSSANLERDVTFNVSYRYYLKNQIPLYYGQTQLTIKKNQSSAMVTVFASGGNPTSMYIDEYAPINLTEYDHWLISQHQLRQSVVTQVNAVRCNQHFTPTTNNGCALGTDAYKWSNINATRLNGAMFPTTAGTYALKVTVGAGGLIYQWVSV